jgi:hypothetical protein
MSWDNIKMALKEIGCEDMDWIHLIQGRNLWQFLVNTIIFHKRQ